MSRNCKDDKSKSDDCGRIAKDANNGENYVLGLLQQLPPTRELLQHYHEKLVQYEQEEKQLLQRISACGQLLDTSNRLEKEVRRKDAEIERLRITLEDLSIALHHERKIGLKLNAENDRLRLNEGRHPKNGTEVRGDKNRKNLEALENEVSALEHQLIQQERLHKEQLEMESNLRREMEKRVSGERLQFSIRVGELETGVCGLEKEMQKLGKQLVQQRSSFIKQERQWLVEREALSRKIQFFQQYGTAGGGPGEAAFHTGHRAEARTSSEKRLKSQVSKLTKDLAEHEGMVGKLRHELLQGEEERGRLKAAATAAAETLARRTKKMAEQVAILTERSEKLETRRSREAEGYQADIKLLRDKIHSLENKLISITMAKANDKENEKILESLRTALHEVDRNKEPEWKS